MLSTPRTNLAPTAVIAAAAAVSPVMAGGGAMPPPAGYFEKMQAVLKEHDILMIADEVVCGFGRTGNTWGSETYGIRPDLLTCAKQISSGYLPIGATLVSGAIFDIMVEQSRKHGMFGIGMTYGGHPVCAAVALEDLGDPAAIEALMKRAKREKDTQARKNMYRALGV